MLTKSSANGFDLASTRNDNNDAIVYYANIYLNVLISGSSKATEVARKKRLIQVHFFFY